MIARPTGRLVLLFALTALMFSGCAFYSKLQARDHLNMGVKAYTSKKYDTAIEEFKTAIELDPELIDAYLYLATAYRVQFIPFVNTAENLRMGQEALARYEEVLELDPANRNAILSMADVHRNLNEPDEAKDWYRTLMDVVPEDRAEALYGIAVIDYNLADEKTGNAGEFVESLEETDLEDINRIVDEGIATLKEALAINPAYTDAMEYLNLLYREKGELTDDEDEKRRWDREAMQLAQQALKLRRQQQLDEERARREVFSKNESN